MKQASTNTPSQFTLVYEQSYACIYPVGNSRYLSQIEKHIFFSSIVKQAKIAVYFTLKSLNQPVLNNEGKVACP